MLPFFDAAHLVLRDRVRNWIAGQLVSTRELDSELETRAIELVRQFGAAGFLKFAVPRQFGGFGDKVEARNLCILREELARGDALADTMFALQALGSYPITLAGSDEQKTNYLARVASGAMIAAFAITEPEAGSDVASLQTTAVRRGEQIVLNGTKRFISNAGIADYYVVFATTEPAKKAKGVSAFIVDANTAGLTVSEKTKLLSPHPIGVLEFTDCAVATTALLGATGDGLKIALAAGICPARAGRSASIQPIAASIWPRHRRIPRYSIEACRNGHRAGSGAIASLSSRLGARCRRHGCQSEVVNGEILRHRGGAAHCRSIVADSRRQRLDRRQHHGAALPRRARAAHLRRHVGDSETCHRAGITKEGVRREA